MNRNKLVVFWSKREQDFLIRYPRSCDGGFICSVFTSERNQWGARDWDKSVLAELEARGYDTKTLRFSVERRKQAAPPTTGEQP